MKFIVIEIQVNADGKVGNIVTTHETREQAESKYHAILSAAAVSSIRKHSAIMLMDTGEPIENRCYEHEEEGE